MTKIRFTFEGKAGLIERHAAYAGGAFIHFGGCGFHYVALRGDLKQAVDAALAA